MATVFFKLKSARLIASRSPGRLNGQPGGLRGAVSPDAPLAFTLRGVTRDSAGAPLGACTVDVFSWPEKTLYGTVTSDGAGAYSLSVAPGKTYRAISYNAADTLTGSSAGTLTGT